MYIPLKPALAAAVASWAATQQRPAGPNPDGTVDEQAQTRSFSSGETEAAQAEAALRAAGYIQPGQEIAGMLLSEDNEVCIELDDRTRMAFPLAP